MDSMDRQFLEKQEIHQSKFHTTDRLAEVQSEDSSLATSAPLDHSTDHYERARAEDLLCLYCTEMSRTRLLTRDEELRLAKRIEAAKLRMLRLLSLTPIATRKVLDIRNALRLRQKPKRNRSTEKR